jgi:uncharacterized protein YcgI (DUF1989 family)
MALIEIPASKGNAALVKKGQSVKLINTHGTQVVDLWAFNSADSSEFLSFPHTHTQTEHVIPKIGDVMVTNRRRPILTLVEDTSPGVHDTQCAACDRYRYELLGVTGFHDSCSDNLTAALSALGLTASHTPQPLNTFMNIPIDENGKIAFKPTVSKAGDYVVLRAEMDLAIAFSCCPQDIVPINGPDCTPVECHFEIA